MSGEARLNAIARLVPRGVQCIDVGADHGYVAHRVGAIATERRPHRAGRLRLPWVIADGLSPFREVQFATICGMGARTIHGILERGPRPLYGAVVHAQDNPPLLRQLLASSGWRMDAEALAPEGKRYAEVLRVVPGHEPSSGETLFFGPCLLSGDDPHLGPHLRQLMGYWSSIADRTRGAAPDVHRAAAHHVAFLSTAIKERSFEWPRHEEPPAR